jgi:hypothetical protein
MLAHEIGVLSVPTCSGMHILWGGALDESELEGNRPRSLWVLRERRLGLEVVSCSYA